MEICGVDFFFMQWIKSQFAVVRWSQILRCAMFVFFTLQCSVKWNYLGCCGFFCDLVMRCLLISFAVLRCSGPPHVPLTLRIRKHNSLHNRRFMSQAGRTRYFARKERVALHAKYRVRSAWLIKRLPCRLKHNKTFHCGFGRSVWWSTLPDFHPHHPSGHRRSVVSSLLLRARNIPSTSKRKTRGNSKSQCKTRPSYKYHLKSSKHVSGNSWYFF